MPDVPAPEWLIRELAMRIAKEIGLGRRLVRYMAEEIATVRSTLHPTTPYAIFVVRKWKP
jgi:hypothetical protein